jgi:hypothetical protein
VLDKIISSLLVSETPAYFAIVAMKLLFGDLLLTVALAILEVLEERKGNLLIAPVPVEELLLMVLAATST